MAAGCFSLSAARPVWAQTHFTLEYEAPAGCPSREAFIDAVRKRVPDAEEREGGAAFHVTIEAEGAWARGRVRLGHGAAEREVVPAPCADVASSMAIMIALVLSGSAPALEADGEAAAPEPPTAPPAPAAPPVKQKANVSQRHVAPARVSPRRPEHAQSERISFGAGAWGAFGFSGGVAPFPATALSGGAELWLDWFAWRPSARAGLLHAAGDTSVEGRGSAEFRLTGFAGRVCPHTISLAASWSIAACGSLEIAELTARGVSTPNGKVQRMPWLALGVAPRAELALGRFASLEAELGVRGVVRHDRFLFEPDATVVYDVPRFAAHGSLGASARFP